MYAILFSGLLSLSAVSDLPTSQMPGVQEQQPPSSLTTEASAVEAVRITAPDPLGLLEQKPDNTVFGLNKSLQDTARQASFVSTETLSRYGVQTIDDLIALAPGSFTDSYYGVAGALALRGTLAETYFCGFKRIENRGTYPTPLGASEQIDIVRGPPTPIMGPGKVGGFLNIVPKSGLRPNGFDDHIAGDLSLETGSYDHQNLTGDLALPLASKLGKGELFLYGEASKDHSFYHGIYPSHELGQLSFGFDFGQGLTFKAHAMLYHSDGSVQTPGWNRVTQALIDHGTYQAGRNTVLKDLNGNGRLDPFEAGTSLVAGYFGAPPAADPRFVLDQGVNTVTLSPRSVFVSPADFSHTLTRTFSTDLTKDFGSGRKLTFEGFYDDLSNQRFVSYGFPADYQAKVLEGRGYMSFDQNFASLKTQSVLGANIRLYDGTQKESFNGGYIALDRRDLSQGPSPTDIFASPFSDPSLGFETAIDSRWRDLGTFAVTDLIWQRLDLTLGARWDDYHAVSRDDGTVVFGVPPHQSYTEDHNDFSYTASLSWHVPLQILPPALMPPLELMPYVTNARTEALELGQAGGLSPQLLSQGTWLTASDLSELGLKWTGFDRRLSGSLGLYRQKRTRLEQGNAVVGTKGEGVELELRAVATQNLSLTFAGNMQRTTVLGPDGGFIVIPPTQAGVADVAGYGGTYAVYATSQLRPGNYDQSLVPHSVLSLYANYSFSFQSFDKSGLTLGGTRVSRTASILTNGFVLPAYVIFNGSLFAEKGDWRLSFNIDNLSNQRYFTPVADVYANVAVLPGVGRNWRLGLKRRF